MYSTHFTKIKASLSMELMENKPQIKYLNNIIEQDHRFIKKITRPMKGFKSFQSANATLIDIELHHMLRKKQHCHAKHITIFEQFYALAA